MIVSTIIIIPQPANCSQWKTFVGSVGIYSIYVILIQSCEIIYLITVKSIGLPYTWENFSLQPSTLEYDTLNLNTRNIMIRNTQK